jgi:hypothetical protein
MVMRILSYIIIVAGLCLLASAGYDEYRGVTREPSSGGYATISSNGYATRDADPDRFHNYMLYHWFYASLIEGLGFFLFLLVRRQDRLDPLSPNFAGTGAFDELDDEMKKEEEQHETPKL